MKQTMHAMRAALILLAAVPAMAGAQRLDKYQWTRVTYVSGESVYLDAGTAGGLLEKAKVEFMRRDTIAAVVEVKYISSSRASGIVVRGDRPVVGDSGRYLAPIQNTLASDSSNASTAGASNAANVRRRSASTTSARVGFRYMQLQTGTSAAGRLTQPALDVRLESHRLGESPFGLVIDARAHNQRSGDGRSDATTRVYQANVELQSAGASPTRMIVGRQLATALSPIGFFDGVTVDADHRLWRVGALAGTQPDVLTFAPAGEIREAGAWIQLHNAPLTQGLYQLTIGVVGSYATASVNREYAIINAIIVTPQYSLYASQELDYNRDWRLAAERGQAMTWSSTFATGRLALGPLLSLNGSYDNRRNVRVYRDFLTPDVSFDDTFRRGYSGGLSLSIPHAYLNIDSRVSDGGTIGRSTSNTAMLSLSQFTAIGVGVRLRATQYDGPTVSGQLASGSIEISPRGLFRLEASVGRRNDTRSSAGFVASRTTWVGFDADFGIGRSWYVMLSQYWETGTTDRLLQQYAGLSWRY